MKGVIEQDFILHRIVMTQTLISITQAAYLIFSEKSWEQLNRVFKFPQILVLLTYLQQIQIHKHMYVMFDFFGVSTCILRHSFKHKKNPPHLSQAVYKHCIEPLKSFEMFNTKTILT